MWLLVLVALASIAGLWREGGEGGSLPRQDAGVRPADNR